MSCNNGIRSLQPWCRFAFRLTSRGLCRITSGRPGSCSGTTVRMAYCRARARVASSVDHLGAPGYSVSSAILPVFPAPNTLGFTVLHGVLDIFDSRYPPIAPEYPPMPGMLSLLAIEWSWHYGIPSGLRPSYSRLHTLGTLPYSIYQGVYTLDTLRT